MMQGKRDLPRRAIMAVSILALLLCGLAGGTLAWLITSTGPVPNVFTPAQVQCKVVESFNEGAKNNVYISNPKLPENVTAYIRVALVPTWEDDQGNVVAKPASLDDLNITIKTQGWLKIGDYYYCTTAIPPGENTPALISSATVKTESGNRMNLHILAEAIQADGVDSSGKSPVELAWKVTLDNSGTITGGVGS